MRRLLAGLSFVALVAGLTGVTCIPTAPEGLSRQTDQGPGGSESIISYDASAPDSSEQLPPTDPHAVLGVDPPHGPFAGGQRTIITGNGFATDVRVWFGPAEASGVVPIDPTRVQVDVPPGSPGPIDVSTRNGDDESTFRTLPAGYAYDALYAIPSSGPVAGGTVIAIYGAATSWDATTLALVDQKPCTTLDAVSPVQLTCTVPQGTPGTKAITVSTGGDTLTALDAFTYEDSQDGFKGGLSGAALAGQLKVLVFDNFTGDAVEGAYAILGSDFTAGHYAQTDSSGLALFDDAALTAPTTVTVAANCHSPITFVDVPVDTVTAYLDPVLSPQCAEGGDVPPVGGKPTSLGLVKGELVWQGGAEFQKAPWVNVPAPTGPDEQLIAYVFFTAGRADRKFQIPAPTNAVYPHSAGGIGYGFNVSAYPGNHTLYALAGIQNDGVNPATFTAYAMGYVRGVAVQPGDTTADVYISMMTPLDQALTLDVTPPPISAKGPDRLLASVAVEIAQSAYAILPAAQKTPLLPLLAPLQFVGLPPLDDELVGNRYICGATAATTSSLTAPLSVISKVAATSTALPVSMTGFVAVADLLAPQPGALWDGRSLAVDYPSGGWPAALTVYDITGGAGLVRWTVAVPAAAHSIVLPDVSSLENGCLPPGPIVIGVYGARIDDFDYGSLSYSNLRPGGMTAYSLDYFDVLL